MREGQFEVGNVPANKGSGWSYHLSERTYCRSCNRLITIKPIDCNSEQHQGLYSRRLGELVSRRALERRKALEHYGGDPLECGCSGCHFDMVKLLELDHINGRGYRHLQARRNGNLAYWLRLHGYPKGFRVLCRACNAVMLPGEEMCELHKWERAHHAEKLHQALTVPA